LIEDGRTGVLFEAGNPDALAQQVLALLSQPLRWPSLRSAARQYVETERNWRASVSRYRDIYFGLTGKRAAA
jgi:glycosyltransferase involved in cell wall biosynthesis